MIRGEGWSGGAIEERQVKGMKATRGLVGEFDEWHFAFGGSSLGLKAY